MQNNKENANWQQLFKPFVPILVLVLIFGLIISLIIEVNYVRQRSAILEGEVALEAISLRDEVGRHVSNIYYLTDLTKRIGEFIPDDESLFKGILSDVFVDFANANQIYDQVRLLDPYGMEVVRINWVEGQPNIVPSHELQDKSDRYYFRKSQSLSLDDIFISAFDLNMENDQIEIPQKPVYRLVTPVESSDGSRLGYIVLNVLGERILDNVKEADKLIEGDLYLLNEQGDWLIGPKHATAWGFMYPDAQNANIAESYPNVWIEYQGEESFQSFSLSGLFTFIVVDQLEGHSITHAEELEDLHEKWILISHLALPSLISESSLGILGGTLIVLAVLFITLRQLAWNRFNEDLAYRAREESEKRLDIISSASKDAIILINQKGLIEHWSKSSEKMFGYSAEEALHKEVHDMVAMHQSDREMAYKGVKKYAVTGKGPIVQALREMDARTKDGKQLPVEISINPFQKEGEWWAVGIVRDIRERRRAEKEIRELAQFPLENANAVMRVDNNSKLRFANPASEFLLTTLKMKVGRKVKPPLTDLVGTALERKERLNKRFEIDGRTILFTVFPIMESGYANVYGIDVTEEERTRSELEASELKYRNLIDTMPQYIFHKDIKGRYVTINESLANLMGLNGDQVRGKTDAQLFGLEIGKKRLDSDLEVMKRKLPIESDAPLDPRNPEGDIVHLIKAPLFDKDGKVEGVLGIFWDITQRVRAEQELARINRDLEKLVQERTREIEVINEQLSISEKRYKAIIENQVEFVFRWDLKGKITYANKSFSNRFSKKVDEIEGLSYKDVIGSKGMDDLYKLMSTITSENPLQTTEIRNIYPDGHVDWVQWNSRAIFNQDDEIVEIQNVGRDITELKQAQEQLHIQSTALEAAANGIVITDKNGNIVWANQALSQLTGYSLSELSGKTPRVFKSGLLEDRYYRDLWKVITSGKVWSGEVINRKKDGSTYTEEMTITPIFTKTGEISNFIAIKQDITNRKIMENETRLAKEQAEVANRAKSTFLANMSHEIRTPLNAIMGLNYLLKRTGVNDMQAQYLDKMQNASRNLLDTINDVLDFSKIEAEKIEIEEIAFTLDDVMLDITDTEALKAHQKGIELIASVGEGVPDRVEGDPIRLKQVLRNLINNAIKFTEKGEVVVEIEKVKESDKVVELSFTISDTGIGLSQEQINKLFTPFQQADISTTRKYGGSGLGLAISDRIVSLMGGKISVKSQIGHGSTFFFEIPFTKVPLKKHTDQFLQKEVINKRVLIVDSNTKSSEWLERILKPTQAEITHVWDLETLQTILDPARKEKPFDVVLVNNNVKGFRRMSDLAGIKQKFHGKDVKVIHLTDTVQYAQQEPDSIENSVDAFLIKPINASQLYETWLTLFLGEDKRDAIGKQFQKAKIQQMVLQGLTILLVEDNEINQEVISELLKQNGAVVDIVENGKIAIQKIKKDKFDLVLMDVQMPVLDGLRATQKIRKDERFTSLPIIGLTANAQAEEMKQAKKVGMNAYITKPIEPKLLFETIIEWTGKDMAGDLNLDLDTTAAEIIIRGVDIGKGLARTNNDIQSYLKLLKKFIKNHNPDMKNMKDHIARKDWTPLRETAHSIRGAAANLGAEELAKTLEAIEHAAVDKNPEQANANFDTAENQFAVLEQDLKNINKEKIEVSEKTAKKPFDRKTFKVKIEKLQKKIKDHDPEAQSLAQEINQLISPDQFDGAFTRAQAFLDAYDFKNARVEVDKVIKVLKENKDG